MGADENNRFVLDGESLRPRFVFIPLYHPFITIRIAQSTMEAMRCLRGAGRRSISLINGNFGKGGEKKFGESGIICWSGKKSIFIRSRGRVFFLWYVPRASWIYPGLGVALIFDSFYLHISSLVRRVYIYGHYVILYVILNLLEHAKLEEKRNNSNDWKRNEYPRKLDHLLKANLSFCFGRRKMTSTASFQGITV